MCEVLYSSLLQVQHRSHWAKIKGCVHLLLQFLEATHVCWLLVSASNPITVFSAFLVTALTLLSPVLLVRMFGITFQNSDPSKSLKLDHICRFPLLFVLFSLLLL